MTYDFQAYDYGYDQHYGYSTSQTDPSNGYIYTYSVYYNANGSYYHELIDYRGPNFDRSYQITITFIDGVYTSDISKTNTPLDGYYHSYGTRDTSTYDLTDHTATANYVIFSYNYSYSQFYSHDYGTGATISSVDLRDFEAYGFYEYTSSFYSGRLSPNYSSQYAYHYSI